jgi:hypothetical protein
MYVPLIAEALEMDYDVVRLGLGYRLPDEPTRRPREPWELESARRARQLLTVLIRVPHDARLGVGLSVDAFLGAFAQEVDRLNAASL